MVDYIDDNMTKDFIEETPEQKRRRREELNGSFPAPEQIDPRADDNMLRYEYETPEERRKRLEEHNINTSLPLEPY